VNRRLRFGGAMSFASPFPEVDIPSTNVYDYMFGFIDDEHLDRYRSFISTG
jgi:hypothetical protein